MVKVGFRKPSIKKSISARTKGRVTRSVKKAVIPGYGQKGMGWAHPKRKIYNDIYQKTTIDTRKVIADAVTSPKKTSSAKTGGHQFATSSNKEAKVVPANLETQFQSSNAVKAQTSAPKRSNDNKDVDLSGLKVIREMCGWSIWLSPIFSLPNAFFWIFGVLWIFLWIVTKLAKS